MTTPHEARLDQLDPDFDLRAEMLKRATRFEWGMPHLFNTVRVEMSDDGHGPYSGDGVPRWAVRWCANRLNVNTGRWDREPQPSSRTKEWLHSHSYTDLADAFRAADKSYEAIASPGAMSSYPAT